MYKKIKLTYEDKTEDKFEIGRIIMGTSPGKQFSLEQGMDGKWYVRISRAMAEHIGKKPLTSIIFEKN